MRRQNPVAEDNLKKVNNYDFYGQCVLFFVHDPKDGDRDLSEKCNSHVSVSSSKAQTLFNFSAGNDTISFESVNNAVNISPESREQPVEKVVAAIGGVGDTESKAVGTCRFGNPFKGKPAKIMCSATVEGGRRLGVMFITDGHWPEKPSQS